MDIGLFCSNDDDATMLMNQVHDAVVIVVVVQVRMMASTGQYSAFVVVDVC
jgi:hypothetical protein